MPKTIEYPKELIPGDVLFYRPSSFLGVIISIKTWTWLSHVEVYCGSGKVVAARIEGVNIYDERLDQYLCAVRRPEMEMGVQFNTELAMKSVLPFIGKSYEIPGLLAFFAPLIRHHRTNRICSVIVTHYLRGGGHKPFNPDLSENDVAPAQLWQSPAFLTIWSNKQPNGSSAGSGPKSPAPAP